VVKAGDGFSFYAVPMNSASTPVATNGYFGTASYFSGLLTAGSGTEVLGQFTGTFGAANGSGAGIGGGSGGTFTYSEAGRFRLGDYAVYDATFANVDRNKASPECFMDGNLGTVTALTTLPNTFNADGKVACFFGNAATTFGRFIPDHFDTVITQTATAPMACPTGLACPARFSGTIYSGQPFTMQVIAKRKGAATAANDGVVTNYNNTSTYARDVTLSAWSARGTTDQALPPAAPAGSVLGVTSVPRARFISGVAELDGSGIPLLARQTYTFGRAYSAAAPTAVGNWIAPTTVYIRATETDVGVPNNIVSDGVTTVRNPVADSEEAGILVLSGRMLVPHVTGSELLRLRVPLLAQYWNGTRWVTNYVDNVSTYSSSEVARSSYVKGLNANNTQLVPQSSAALVKGAGQFYMQAAGAGISGSVDFNLTGPTWLPSTIGRSRVGTYRSPLIFIREVY
jgi:MSHA biogenesis protein MshQ